MFTMKNSLMLCILDAAAMLLRGRTPPPLASLLDRPSGWLVGWLAADQ